MDSKLTAILAGGQHAPATPWAKAGWTLAALVAAAYVAVFVRFAPALLQDYPDHLARALVINDLWLHRGAEFGAVFQFTFMAVPYVLNDVLLAGAIEVVGVKSAAILWQVLMIVSLPAALALYARAADIRREGQAVAFLLGLYLATSAFFLKGFFAFELALSAILVVLALARTLCASWSYALYGGYVAAFTLSYLVHLSAIVLLAPALALSTLLMIRRRRIGPVEGALLMLPLGLLFAWHFGVASGQRLAGDGVSSTYYWGSLLGKARGILWPFQRFSLGTDRWLLIMFIVCLVWPYRTRHALQGFTDPLVGEMGVLAIAYLGVYIVLPLSLSDASWIDVRAIPLAAMFLLMASLAAAGRGPSSNRTVADAVPLLLAATLAVANLVYLDRHLGALDAWLARYRTVVSAVPTGAYVLPVYTNTRDRPIKSTLHAASLLAIDRAAIIPYFFSGDQGEPMTYFRYKHRPYAPQETWYVEPGAGEVDWHRVACEYGFLLVMKPYEPARFAIETRPIAENDAAALLAIAPGGCAAPEH
jgi:hypothetical protein